MTDPAQCTYTSSNGGTTFDLAPLRLDTTPAYLIYDERKPTHGYYFNFCNVTGTPPNDDDNICKTRNGTDQIHPVDVPAWQVEYSNGKVNNCQRLTDSATPVMSYISDTNPALGVLVTYVNGSNLFCPFEGVSRVKREFALRLYCAPDAGGDWGMNGATSLESVEESHTCIYSAFLKSIHGCPIQCTGGSNSICSNNGACGFNIHTQKSQCYCYDNYEGAFCGDEVKDSSKGIGATGVLLIIVCIILAAVIGTIIYMWRKLRRLNVSPDSLKGMAGKHNRLDQLTDRHFSELGGISA